MSKEFVGYGGLDADLGAPLSPGVLCDGWLFVSGQMAIDLEAKQVVRGTMEEQARLALQNLKLVLEEGGCTFDDVVKTTIHIADFGDFAGLNKAYSECFKGVRPARTTVVSGLWNGLLVEIDAVARVPAGDTRSED
ncbi:MAG: RidA family protein [Chloroflexota bacterium]|nr:RidA family protein [Chloroflexota bacterium]